MPIDDTHSLTPGPGKQIVILDLPAGAPVDRVIYDYRISFEQRVRKDRPDADQAFLTAKLTVNGKTFYQPMLPCAASFASLPDHDAAFANAAALVLPQGLAGCANEYLRILRTESAQVGACDLDNDHDVDKNDLT